jgi:hypothetical protein
VVTRYIAICSPTGLSPTAYLRALRPRQSTFKIRTILGPPSVNSPTNYAFTLVKGMQRLYSQQTKNLLVAIRRSTPA